MSKINLKDKNYLNEKLLKAYFCKEKININGDKNIIVKNYKNINNGYNVFYLSNGEEITIKSDLSPNDELKIGWEFNSKKEKEKEKNNNRKDKVIKKFSEAINLLNVINFELLSFILLNEDKFEKEMIDDIKKYIDENYELLKELINV